MYMFRPCQVGGLLCNYFMLIERAHVPNVPSLFQVYSRSLWTLLTLPITFHNALVIPIYKQFTT